MTIIINDTVIALTNLAKNQFVNGEICPVLSAYVPPAPKQVAVAYCE